MQQVTVDTHFDASHILPNHNGKCRRLHGHTYRMIVSVQSSQALERQDVGMPTEGMLLDFGALKSIVQDDLLDHWDHRFLAKGDEWPVQKVVSDLRISPDNICFVDRRTTAENLSLLAAEVILERLQKKYGAKTAIGVSVTLFEGLTNSATSSIGSWK